MPQTDAEEKHDLAEARSITCDQSFCTLGPHGVWYFCFEISVLLSTCLTQHENDTFQRVCSARKTNFAACGSGQPICLTQAHRPRMLDQPQPQDCVSAVRDTGSKDHYFPRGTSFTVQTVPQGHPAIHSRDFSRQAPKASKLQLREPRNAPGLGLSSVCSLPCVPWEERREEKGDVGKGEGQSQSSVASRVQMTPKFMHQNHQ